MNIYYCIYKDIGILTEVESYSGDKNKGISIYLRKFTYISIEPNNIFDSLEEAKKEFKKRHGNKEIKYNEKCVDAYPIGEKIMTVKKKKERWTIKGILGVLEKEGMEVYTIHEIVRTKVNHEQEIGFAVCFSQEKSNRLK